MTEDSPAIQLILNHGKTYKTALLPADIERGPLGKCFDWCALQAARHRQYRYVEGLASNPQEEDDWVLHAWLTDGKQAFDPTWAAEDKRTKKQFPVPASYVGIEMDIISVARFMSKTGYQSVLGNYWRNPELAERIHLIRPSGLKGLTRHHERFLAWINSNPLGLHYRKHNDVLPILQKEQAMTLPTEQPAQDASENPQPGVRPSVSKSLPPILDAACGGRRFWFNKEHPDVLYIDNRPTDSEMIGKGKNARIHECSPDRVMDFRKLDLPDNHFSLVVFDPPHFTSLGENSYMAKKYGKLDRTTWRDDLTKGFAECFRVLRPGSFLIFKWNEHDIPLREVLALTPIRPLFGHPSGKTQKTHWVCFMKTDDAVIDLAATDKDVQ
jgi:SAM-dependent methyltransferase